MAYIPNPNEKSNRAPAPAERLVLSQLRARCEARELALEADIQQAEETKKRALKEIEDLEVMLASARSIYHSSLSESHQLRDMRDKNARQLRTGRSLLHPIRHLPAELLVEIVSIVVDAEMSDKRKQMLSKYSHRRLRAPTAAFTLAAVCQKWRSVLLQSPNLWRDLFLSATDFALVPGDRNGVARRQLRRVNLNLERSRNFPLNLYLVHEETDSSPDFRHLCRDIRRKNRDVESITASVTGCTDSLLFEYLPSANNITLFSRLHVDNLDFGYSDTKFFLRNDPCLLKTTRLSITNTSTPITPFSYSPRELQLTSLQSQVDLGLVSLLDSLPLLGHLELLFDSDEDWEDAPYIPRQTHSTLVSLTADARFSSVLAERWHIYGIDASVVKLQLLGRPTAARSASWQRFAQSQERLRFVYLRQHDRISAEFIALSDLLRPLIHTLFLLIEDSEVAFQAFDVLAHNGEHLVPSLRILCIPSGVIRLSNTHCLLKNRPNLCILDVDPTRNITWQRIEEAVGNEPSDLFVELGLNSGLRSAVLALSW